ncbi:hypothetical protein [Propionispora sp. 2/2-37]|nr:hypothetical protein [Propionispora sp. 2/2-37]
MSCRQDAGCVCDMMQQMMDSIFNYHRNGKALPVPDFSVAGRGGYLAAG